MLYGTQGTDEGRVWLGETMDWGCPCVGYFLMALSVIPIAILAFLLLYREKLEITTKHPLVVGMVVAFVTLLVAGIAIVVVRS